MGRLTPSLATSKDCWPVTEYLCRKASCHRDPTSSRQTSTSAIEGGENCHHKYKYADSRAFVGPSLATSFWEWNEHS